MLAAIAAAGWRFFDHPGLPRLGFGGIVVAVADSYNKRDRRGFAWAASYWNCHTDSVTRFQPGGV